MLLFDVQAALDEILAAPLATPATSATNAPENAPVSQVSRVSQSQPAEIATPADVLPFAPPPSAPLPSRQAETFPHGLCRITGRPRTWTGKVVSLGAWREMSEWDRNGSTGKLFCGICWAWVTDCPHCIGGAA